MELSCTTTLTAVSTTIISAALAEVEPRMRHRDLVADVAAQRRRGTVMR
jgi:heme exporter protein D